MSYASTLGFETVLILLGYLSVFFLVGALAFWLSGIKFLPGVKFPRLFRLLLANVALIVVIHFLAPQQLIVTLYKLSLVTLAGNLGYWLDRAIFPYARPDALMEMDLTSSFNMAMIRRAVIVGCAMLAMGLGA